MAEKLTAERLREVLHYNPETGVFTWRVTSSNRALAGSVAGAIDGHGYQLIGVDRVRQRANRLAWLYMTGEWPEYFVDHIDGDALNNRWENLRHATNAENMQNRRKPRSDKKNGKLLGTCFHALSGKWGARIRANNAIRSLGYFDTEAEAHAAYMRAKGVYHPFSVDDHGARW
jgi:hypothetical protein